MLKIRLFAAALAALLASQPAHAQKAAATDIKPVGKLDPRDKKVLPYATGALETFRDWGWYQVLGYCAAVHMEQSERLKQAKKTAEHDRMERELANRYHNPAIMRVSTDRGITADAAVRIVDVEIIPNLDFLGNQEDNGFEAESARCKAAAAAYENGGTPPAAATAPAAPAAVKPVERLFKANAALTRAYDGKPYWELMIRCAMGWSNGPGQAPLMAKQFTRNAGHLLQNEMKLDKAAAEAKAHAAMAGFAPIAPVDTTPETDPCLAIAKQMVAEARSGQ